MVPSIFHTLILILSMFSSQFHKYHLLYCKRVGRQSIRHPLNSDISEFNWQKSVTISLNFFYKRALGKCPLLCYHHTITTVMLPSCSYHCNVTIVNQYACMWMVNGLLYLHCWMMKSNNAIVVGRGADENLFQGPDIIF